MIKSAKSIWVGFAIGLTCIIYSMVMSGDLKTFLNWPSFFITIGGTLGSLVVSFPMNRLKTIGPVIRKAFVNQKYDTKKDIATIVSLAQTARKQGLLALEDVALHSIDDEFLKRGVLLIVDGADKEQLKTSLEEETYFMQQRHQSGSAMLDMIATTAPSLGLLGTYIGLIPMLNNLEDPTKLGPLMAIELVTSFLGAFFAYVIFAPLSKRLKIMNADEVARRELLLEGLIAIEESENPRVIEEKLVSCLMKREKEKSAVGRQRQDKFGPKKAA